MRVRDKIDDPKWSDIIDRDTEIERLTKELEQWQNGTWRLADERRVALERVVRAVQGYDGMTVVEALAALDTPDAPASQPEGDSS